MNTKQDFIAMLTEEYERWVALLDGVGEEQANRRQLPGDLSIKDVVAHLWAWQQRSVARMEAALGGHEPYLPRWGDGLDPDREEHLHQVNAWILETYRPLPWQSVYSSWSSGFQRFLELARQIPEEDLLRPGKYEWLQPYPLSAVLEGSYDHHHEEHLQPLLAWMRETGRQSLAGLPYKNSG